MRQSRLAIHRHHPPLFNEKDCIVSSIGIGSLPYKVSHAFIQSLVYHTPHVYSLDPTGAGKITYTPLYDSSSMDRSAPPIGGVSSDRTPLKVEKRTPRGPTTRPSLPISAKKLAREKKQASASRNGFLKRE